MKVPTAIGLGFVSAILLCIAGCCVVPIIAPLVGLGFIPTWIGLSFVWYYNDFADKKK